MVYDRASLSSFIGCPFTSTLQQQQLGKVGCNMTGRELFFKARYNYWLGNGFAVNLAKRLAALDTYEAFNTEETDYEI